MSLIALQRIIKAGDKSVAHGVTIWYLLLDTNSSIFELAPSGSNSPSDRLIDHMVPLPVWPYLGFNQMVPAEYGEDAATAGEALSIEHLKVYGRPVSGDILFYPYIVPHILCFQYWFGLENGHALDAATQKLFYEPSPALKSFNPSNIHHVLAAFSVRLSLEIGEGEASERLARNAVHSHMRILRGAIGPLVITASPSEPILAIAAATSLNQSSEAYKTAIVTLLDRLVLHGLVIDRGMLCSRLLLTLARDKAALAQDKVASSFVQDGLATEGPRVRAVELSLFLQALLGEKLGISGDAALRTEFLSAVSGVWVNFTHFVQLTGSLDQVTPAFLLWGCLSVCVPPAGDRRILCLLCQKAW